MSLFANDPPIEQWFKALFADLLDAFPGTTGGLKLMPKYWHSLQAFSPENLGRAFIRATETCKFFPKVPELLEIQSSGFGSQPYIKKREEEKLPDLTREQVMVNKEFMQGLMGYMADHRKANTPEEKEQVKLEFLKYQDEVLRPKFKAAVGDFNPDTGEEYGDEVPF